MAFQGKFIPTRARHLRPNFSQEMCVLLDIDKTRTTPYWPRSDGMVERFNRTLENMLFHYVSSNQKNWDQKLPFMMMAYRSTVHDSTGF